MINLRDHVLIDNDSSLVGIVTALTLRSVGGDSVMTVVEVSYIHNGDAKMVFVEPWRLKVLT